MVRLEKRMTAFIGSDRPAICRCVILFSKHSGFILYTHGERSLFVGLAFPDAKFPHKIVEGAPKVLETVPDQKGQFPRQWRGENGVSVSAYIHHILPAAPWKYRSPVAWMTL
jgi:hypothetical protein